MPRRSYDRVRVSVWLSRAGVSTLADIASAVGATRSHIHREALRLGADAICADPSAVRPERGDA